MRTFSHPPSHSFYGARVSDFLEMEPLQVLGALTKGHSKLLRELEREQIQAWERELDILRSTFRALGEVCAKWSLLIEMPLHRLGKRLDAVVLSPGVVCVVEFKIGATTYDAAARLQTESYAHALHDFHKASQTRWVVPILCAEKGPDRPTQMKGFDHVADLIETNAYTLSIALREAATQFGSSAESIPDWHEFDASPYQPTPSIIEAARTLYAGHRVADIGRGDATDENLQRTADALRATVRSAESRREKVVCFVTGAPGAGKTLLGLDLAFTRFPGSTSATLLSGNRPLVHVLTEALASDLATRTQQRKEDAKRVASKALQNLLDYIKQHTAGGAPDEHVLVFDEAQRAWNATVGKRLLKRNQSEPESFLEILGRHEWACLVCLVGPGQEINDGEGGLALWGEALSNAAARGHCWSVVAAPQALRGGLDVTGPGLLPVDTLAPFPVREEPSFHLANSFRAFRNSQLIHWVARLLEGNLQEARRIAAEMTVPPALLTRELTDAKAWLRTHRRGGRSTGLLASSEAVRLIADGVPPSPRTKDPAPIGHWFLKPFTDFRSSGALETPLSEFGCQGLEVDYSGLCWGGDLLWEKDAWRAREMKAPRWTNIHGTVRRQFRLNSYRVLLTRARGGMVIYVPKGAEDDPTRRPSEFDEIANALLRAGCQMLPGPPTSASA
ncbi:DNA/RNA helicase domain-containing protein [Corallococcus sp. CA054B]|uniref:DNA/RNA helicase domain-containing protein n=1 Tax=Corallococcus sp. CA054B TaxID=2316734 RepID=UPI0011C47E3F|nr:DNA/RNA helicase domain-containing protein [Corallococcus sp. CA054B]